MSCLRDICNMFDAGVVEPTSLLSLFPGSLVPSNAPQVDEDSRDNVTPETFFIRVRLQRAKRMNEQSTLNC